MRTQAIAQALRIRTDTYLIWNDPCDPRHWGAVVPNPATPALGGTRAGAHVSQGVSLLQGPQTDPLLLLGPLRVADSAARRPSLLRPRSLGAWSE